MKLWIRSQDRERLTLTGDLRIDYCVENGMYGIDSCDYIGFYKTKERALEVLDEIQEKLKNKFLCKPNILLQPKDVAYIENELNAKYTNDFIMQPQALDIEPINCDIVIYEMPKE